jgi:prolyl oligopeptidase
MTSPRYSEAPAYPQALIYPHPQRLDLTEEVSGHLVHDPYRWLEEAGGDETQAWLAAQDALFAQHRARLPGREALAARIRELMGAGFVGAPAWRGQRQFYLRRTAEQEHAVVYTSGPGAPDSGTLDAASAAPDAAGPGTPDPGGERALIDPMAIDPSGRTTLDAWQPDKEGRLLAYQLSEGGDEESLLRVLDVETGQQVDGPIDRCRYSGIAWLPGGKAFYYTRRLPPGEVPAGEEQYHRRVYLHQVGSPAEEDVLIFGEGRDKTDYYAVSVSWDGRWLTIGASRGTAPRNDLWLADLTSSDPAAPELRVVQEGIDAQTGVRAGRDGRLYVFTDADAPRGRLAVADPADPGYPNWRDLIPADPEAVLSGFAILDGPALDGSQDQPGGSGAGRPVLLASWTRHAISEISVHDLETGERTGSVPVPGLGTVGGLSERPEGGHEAWFGYTDNTTAATVQHYEARTGTTRTWAQAPGTVAVPDVRTRQVTYRSKDGTQVRMLVMSAGDGTPNESTAGDISAGDISAGDSAAGGATGDVPAMAGPRPAILYGYGGFGISLTPAYSAVVLAWVEAGGVYAKAGLRGGSEEGEEWHRAGMLSRKQDVFDDFHAAAEKLIADGWTTAEQLAISGGSNGGLLVGAAITQRPELYAAAACSAPLLDMVRYERFGLGETWNTEYGTAADPDELGWLLSYSPYHNVTEGTAYPAVLFTVFDSDTRVDPVHAWKMCAALQHATSASAPVLLRREAQVGHAARAVSRSVDLSADTLAFLAHHTGLPA